jgi:putative membrane protein
LNFSVEQLPAVNAALNATAAVLLVWGWVEIKRRREQAHKRLMLTAFGVSSAFLACYLLYHFKVGHVKFAGPEGVRKLYYAILLSHVLLAVTVPVLAGVTIYLGIADRRSKHRQLARWTFPIWLYVSITGVVIYVMLYHLYPASPQGPIIEGTAAAERRAVDEPGPGANSERRN